MAEQGFNPRATATFHFGRCAYDPATGEAELEYRLDDSVELTERVVFPHAPWPPEPSRQAAFHEALHLLHLIAGVSYWKACLAPAMAVDEGAPAPAVTGFLRELYVQGLAEFGYVNRVDVAARFSLDAAGEEAAMPRPLLLPDRALVAMGGGKDSLVGLEMLRQSGVEVMPVCVGHSPLIRQTVAAAGLPLLQIGRAIAPELRELNQAGAWNGHVPVTAINSAILLCAAILYGFRFVVFANERSADEATLETEDGGAINHQYSKTTAFERAFRDIISARISPDIEYFSVLRPYSELEIVRRFSSLKQFHASYSSCNRNFHLDGPAITGRWCGRCPKCQFAALSLALFLPPGEVVAIQGCDLLDDPEQLDSFRALCGLAHSKPFECVGEVGESRAALAALVGMDAWRDHRIVRALARELAGVEIPELDSLLAPAPAHFIPPRIAAALGVSRP